jgi:hypothetical protein
MARLTNEQAEVLRNKPYNQLTIEEVNSLRAYDQSGRFLAKRKENATKKGVEFYTYTSKQGGESIPCISVYHGRKTSMSVKNMVGLLSQSEAILAAIKAQSETKKQA